MSKENYQSKIDIDIDSINIRNALGKLIWEVKLKFANKEGGYDIPEKQLKTIQTLVNTVKFINDLSEVNERLIESLMDEKRMNIKMSEGSAKKNIEIMKLKRQLEF